MQAKAFRCVKHLLTETLLLVFHNVNQHPIIIMPNNSSYEIGGGGMLQKLKRELKLKAFSKTSTDPETQYAQIEGKISWESGILRAIYRLEGIGFP